VGDDQSPVVDGQIRGFQRTGEPLSTVREQLPAGLADALAAVQEPGESVERSVETRTEDGRRYYLLIRPGRGWLIRFSFMDYR